MKILYVINSLDGGGGALPLPRVLGLMREAGHDVRVLAMMRRDARGCDPLRAAGFDFSFAGGAQRRWLGPAATLWREARRERPDLIWTSLTHATITGQLVGKALGIPVASWLHNAWLKPSNAAVLRRTAPLTRHWIADSEASADFGVHVLGLSRARISVWPMYCAPAEVPAAPAYRDGPFRIGSLGRLHPQKGYGPLIDALARARQLEPATAAAIRIDIAGEGALRDELAQKLQTLGLSNVTLRGFVHDPAAFLASLHAYVQPSHHEGLCIAVHEAMAAGLPVIGSPVGEMARSIPAAGAGTLVPFGDVDGLARALLDLARDPIAARLQGERARAWALDTFSEARFRERGRAAIASAFGLDAGG